MSHMTHRQLHRLCTFKTRTGSSAIRSFGLATNTAASDPFCANMANPFLAEGDIAPQYFCSFSKQTAQRCSYPTGLAVDLQRLQPCSQFVRQPPEKRFRRKLQPTCHDHYFDIVGRHLGEDVRGTCAAVANCNEVCGCSRPDSTSPVIKAKDVGRPGDCQPI